MLEWWLKRKHFLCFLFCVTDMLRGLNRSKNWIEDDDTMCPKECMCKTPTLLLTGLVKPHVASTHLRCLVPLLSHFHSISLHQTWQNNSTYTAVTSRNDKYRGKHPRDGSGVGSSKLTKDWLVMQKQSKGSLFFPDTPGTKPHTFIRPRWPINAEQTEGSTVRALVCMVPVSFMEATAHILLPTSPAQHLRHTLTLLLRALRPVNLILFLSTNM